MTFHVEHQPQALHVTGLVGGVVPVVRTVQAWIVEDDEQIICQVIALPEHDYAEIYAERIAELLNRHGLSDIPDHPGGAT